MLFNVVDRMDQRKKTISIVVFSIVVSLTLAILLSFGMSRVFRRSKLTYHTISIGSPVGSTKEILDGDEYTQVFTVPFDKIKGLEVMFSMLGQEAGEGKAIISLSHNGEVLRTWKKKITSIRDDVYKRLFLKQTCNCTPGDEFKLTVRTEGAQAGHSFGIRAFAEDSPYVSENANVRGEAIDTKLSFNVLGSFPADMRALIPIMLFLSLVLSLILARGLFYRYWNGTTRLDELIIFLIVTACCLLFTQFSDQLNTSMGGIYFLSAVKEGKLLDYYSYQFDIIKFGMAGNYNIVVYLVMAIIHLPYYLLMQIGAIDLDAHTIVLYYSLFLGVLFYVCGRVFNKILKGYGLDDEKASFGRTMFYLSPIVLFGSVGFVQQDLLYLIFLFFGIRLYQKGHRDIAFLVISVSVALKSLPLFIIVPFILLSEKNIWKDIRYVIEILLVSLITGIIYGSDAGYQSVDHSMYYENLFTSRIVMSHWEVSLFLLIWLVFCCLCFYKKPMKDWENLFIASLGGYTIFAMFCGWNPQYLVGYGVAISAFAIITSDKNRYFAVMTVMAGALIVFSCLVFEGNVDNWMCNHGLPYLLTDIESRIQPITLSTIAKQRISLPFELTVMGVFSLLQASIVFLLFRGISEIRNNNSTLQIKKDEIYSILVYLPVIPMFLYMMISYGLLLGQ